MHQAICDIYVLPFCYLLSLPSDWFNFVGDHDIGTANAHQAVDPEDNKYDDANDHGIIEEGLGLIHSAVKLA